MQVREVIRPADPYIQSLLALDVWDGLTITFSFPTATQFSGYNSASAPLSSYAAFTDTQKAAVRHVLETISSFTNLTFEEVSGANAGNATLRFGNTAETDSAYAYLPTSDALGGDSWYANQSYMRSPVIGDYAYMTILHEIGHALGLVHPHEPEVGSPMPPDRDWMAYTVMSYRSAPNGEEGYYNSDSDFAQTYMLEDIAALQHAYGANYTANAGNTVYSFNPATGEYSINGVGQGTPAANIMFVTIWDGGGTDTYDFSAYSRNGNIDLRPGNWSQHYPNQLAQLGGGSTPPGSVANADMFNGDPRSLIENAIGGSGWDYISGNEAVNRLEGGAGRDIIDGYGGNDSLFGGPDSDTLNGGAGTDLLYGESGGDELHGDDGADTLRGGDGSDSLSGGSDNDILWGQAGDDTLGGDSGDDLLIGGVGRDWILGGDGNDIIQGGTEDDEMRGGRGDDVFVVNDAGDNVTEYADQGIDLVKTFVSFTLGINVENLQLMVGGLVGTGNALDNMIYGGTSSDTIYGLDGNDTIYGRSGNDVVWGGDGDDLIFGEIGDDTLDGGDGSDTAVFSGLRSAYTISEISPGAYRIVGTDGNDILRNIESAQFSDTTIALGGPPPPPTVIVGTENAEILQVTADPDEIYGLDGNDIIRALGGNDTLYGGDGSDELRGGDSYDALWGGLGHDDLFGGAGEDTLQGEGGNDRLYGNADDDFINGGAGNDNVFGGGGNDTVYGGNGADIVNGHAGDDLIVGGSGIDLLTGGLGADRFMFNPGHLGGGLSVTDRIRDFSQAQGDTIDLHYMDADSSAAGIQAFAWIGAAAFSGIAGELRSEIVGRTTTVDGDTDGDGAADFALWLTGQVGLNAWDFVL
jgi:serralysin